MSDSRLTTTELKKINRNQVFSLIYQEERISKQEIAARLRMSLPTVTQNIKELEELNLIEKNGLFESTGGRKPQVISCVRNAKVAIGLEITKKRIDIVAVGLYAQIINQETWQVSFENTPAYFTYLGNSVNNFISKLRIAEKRILGVGIAVQGFISPDGQTVSYGEVMNATGVTLKDFAQHINYSCRLFHDSEMAARSEMWFSKDLTNALYIAINENIGAASIIHGELHYGKERHSGAIEHMYIEKGGRLCYCGKHGCLEAYCSINSLLSGSNDTLKTFFTKLRESNPTYIQKWDEYLSYMALAIDNSRMVLESDVILGGRLATYLTTNDIDMIFDKIKINTAFEITVPFLRIGRCQENSVMIGAALTYIDDFLKSI